MRVVACTCHPLAAYDFARPSPMPREAPTISTDRDVEAVLLPAAAASCDSKRPILFMVPQGGGAQTTLLRTRSLAQRAALRCYNHVIACSTRA